MTAPLSENEVHVWHCHCDDPTIAARRDNFLALLTAEETARYRRFAFEKDRQLFLVAHALLRTVLSRYAAVAPDAWKFQLTAHGKPFLPADAAAPPLQFNISPSDQVAVCAVTLTHAVGVDVESAGRQADPRVAQRVLSPPELERFLAAHDSQQRELFFRYWTLKEAYAKAIGLGLSLRLSEISFTLDEPTAPHIRFAPSSRESADSWQFHQQFLDPHHYLAVAVRCPRNNPARFRLIHSPPLL